ncbi:MAG: ribosome assembly factor SBDS [Candidatus Diapherotrites archaeon]
MVKLEDAVIARLERSGEKFEVLVDPNLATDVKGGKDVNIGDLLAIDTVFKDARKGEEKGEESIKKVFGTTNLKEVVWKIILEGDVQLTTQQRRDMHERKRKEIVAFIARNAINPQANAPHPPQRIENAMEEAKIKVDINRPVRDQLPDIIKELKKLLPISMEKLEVAIKIPAEFSGKGSAMIRKYEIKKEGWQNDGSFIAVLEIPAGTKNDLFNELNHLTHGSVETKIIAK